MGPAIRFVTEKTPYGVIRHSIGMTNNAPHALSGVFSVATAMIESLRTPPKVVGVPELCQTNEKLAVTMEMHAHFFDFLKTSPDYSPPVFSKAMLTLLSH